MSPRKPRLSRTHLHFLRAATRETVAAARRRLRSGASHPSWPWLYEFTAAFMRTAAIEFEQLAIEWARGQISPVPLALKKKLKLQQDELGGLRIDLYRAPTHTGSEPTVLYLHGGGYVTCSPASHRDIIARIAHVADARVVAPYYRLAPEHPYPAALEDALAVYRALLRQGVKPERLFLAGDSAGGGLSLALMCRLRDEGEPLPRAAVLISPWVDLSLTLSAHDGRAPLDFLGPERVIKNAAAYAGTRPLHDPSISPVFADLGGLPPLLVQTGSWELLHEQNERLVARARAAGVDVKHEIEPGMLHAFTCFAGVLPQGRAALASIGEFVRAHAAQPPRSVLQPRRLEPADVA
jgi:monoterpene epsilon-lactone hydrolase